MGLFDKLWGSAPNNGKEKLPEERLPEEGLTLDDVVPHSPTPVKIEGSVQRLRKPGSRRDRREKILEHPWTRADRRMKKKLARRRARKERRSRK